MLSGMDDCMMKMELSQARIDDEERMRGAVDSGMFTSMIGTDFSGKLHRDALEWLDLRSLQDPRSEIDQQRTPKRAQQPPAHIPTYQLSPLHLPQLQAPPYATTPPSALTQFRTPNAKQRKLAIRDKVYIGLGSGSSTGKGLLSAR